MKKYLHAQTTYTIMYKRSQKTKGVSDIIYDEEERVSIGDDNIRSLVNSSDGIIYVRNEKLEIDFEIARS
jgi:hypothetical protein